MCILDACCYCIFLDVGCMIIAAILLVFRIVIIVFMLNHPSYKDFNFTEDFSAAHATIILAAIGCIIPIFLMWGVCTGSPSCVCSFIILEVIYVFVNIVWEMYFIITHYSKEGRASSFYDDPGRYDYGLSDDYNYSYDGKQIKHRKYTEDDLFWLAPVIFILVEAYFLWVAYSYYRFLQDEYDDFYEPAVFYA